MTDRQIMYIDLCKRGYSLEEIADMTGRTKNAVLSALKKAVARPCRDTPGCGVCIQKAACDQEYASVMAAKQKKTLRQLQERAYEEKREQRSRYSY